MAIGDQIRSGATAAAQPVTSGVSQTAFIFAAIAFLFLFYVTIKGDLPKWLGLFAVGKPASSASTGSAPGTNTAGAALPDVLAGQHANPPALPTLPTIDTGTWSN